MSKREIAEQTRLAFEFIQKLYLEVSYLIKEIEGLLSTEKEEFVIGRSGGYAITGIRSLGLEANIVNSWPLRKMSVFFVPKQATKYNQGITITKFEKNPKIIYLRILLDDKGLGEPMAVLGVLHSFVGKKFEKVEQVMAHIEYNDTKVFGDGKNILDHE